MHFHMHRGCGPRHGMAGGRWQRGPFSFSFDAGEEWGGRRERGGRSRRMFDGAELRLVLLRMIADEPRHGYELIKAIEEMTAGAYAPSPGVVYPALTMLAEMGHTAEQKTEDARKKFEVTHEGAMHLEENREQVEALMERLTQLGEHRGHASGAPIRRAMGNLRVALQNRLSRGDFSEDTLHDVAALIDELAQKIERLR